MRETLCWRQECKGVIRGMSLQIMMYITFFTIGFFSLYISNLIFHFHPSGTLHSSHRFLHKLAWFLRKSCPRTSNLFKNRLLTPGYRPLGLDFLTLASIGPVPKTTGLGVSRYGSQYRSYYMNLWLRLSHSRLIVLKGKMRELDYTAPPAHSMLQSLSLILSTILVSLTMMIFPVSTQKIRAE